MLNELNITNKIELRIETIVEKYPVARLEQHLDELPLLQQLDELLLQHLDDPLLQLPQQTAELLPQVKQFCVPVLQVLQSLSLQQMVVFVQAQEELHLLWLSLQVVPVKQTRQGSRIQKFWLLQQD